MFINNKIRDILDNYESELPSVLSNLYKILMHGKLSGTGKMVILPVDQGFEHGPDRSFAVNTEAYDPHYHFKLAIESGVNAYAAPLGMIQSGARSYVGQVPLILKMNSSNSLLGEDFESDQAVTATVKDAVDLGCSAIGFTIYPGSNNSLEMINECRELIAEAKSYGLASVVWSYPRGGDLKKEDESAIDVCCYAAHMAALIGANIIKVKVPTEYIALKENKKIYAEHNINVSTVEARIKQVVKSCFNGMRLVVFSGGATKNIEDLYNECKSIYLGGGNGSIIGRNVFQRPKNEAISMLNQINKIYLDEK